MAFFMKQSKRRLETEYLAYDTTSISSYSNTLKQVKYGMNKEHDLLPQINLVLVFGEESKLPVYYRKLPGNITDVKTIQNLLKEIDFLQIDKVQLVMGRGFYSEANVNKLFKKHYKFVMGVKTSLKFVQKRLDEIRDTFISRINYNAKRDLYIKSFTNEWTYKETMPRSGEVIINKRRLYVHYYYNDQHATDDKNRFYQLLNTLIESKMGQPY